MQFDKRFSEMASSVCASAMTELPKAILQQYQTSSSCLFPWEKKLKPRKAKHHTWNSCCISDRKISFLRAAETQCEKSATPAFDCRAQQETGRRNCHQLWLNYCSCGGWWQLGGWQGDWGLSHCQSAIQWLKKKKTFHWCWHSKYQVLRKKPSKTIIACFFWHACFNLSLWNQSNPTNKITTPCSCLYVFSSFM